MLCFASGNSEGKYKHPEAGIHSPQKHLFRSVFYHFGACVR